MDRHGAGCFSAGTSPRPLGFFVVRTHRAYSVITLTHAALQTPGSVTQLHRAVLLPLLGIDLALIAAHVATSAVPGDPWSVESDRGIAESFQYLKWMLLGLAFAAAAWNQRAVGYLAWSLLFACLLVDDRYQLHERAGGYFAARVELPWLRYLRPQDVGELLGTAAVATSLLVPIAAAWRWGNAALRRTTYDMLVLLALLAVFGVVIDALHSAVLHLPTLSALLGTLEDGGEMMVASLMVAYAVALWRQARRPGYADGITARLALGH